MRYYVLSDIHSYFEPMRKALLDAGYFDDPMPHKLIILGDLFDRGEETVEVLNFVLQEMEKDQVILIRGNHEDLLYNLVTVDHGLPYSNHIHNGTFETAAALAGLSTGDALKMSLQLCAGVLKGDFVQKVLPEMRDYYETKNYIFVHGWIPCNHSKYEKEYGPVEDWRDCGETYWRSARWYNGMEVAALWQDMNIDPTGGKTVVVGHWHTSYGHSTFEHRGSEFGKDADYSPYYGKNVIALDACTVVSRKVNCIVLEDAPMEQEGEEQ